MKKHTAVIVSDVHYDAERLRALMPVINSSELFVFCGDGLNAVMNERGAILVPMVCVRGNNDFYTDITDTAIAMLGDMRFMVTHGHRQGVKNGISGVLAAAENNDCRLAFFGHTHMFCDRIEDGVRLINPGALCAGAYAFVTYDGARVVCERRSV